MESLEHSVRSGTDTSVVTVQTPNPVPALTVDLLREIMEEGQKQIDDLNDKLVESLIYAGFKVLINEDIPEGMIAVLPGNFKGSLKRAMAKLHSGDRRFGAIHSLNWMA